MKRCIMGNSNVPLCKQSSMSMRMGVRICVYYIHSTLRPDVYVIQAIKRRHGCGYLCVSVISLHSPIDRYLCVCVCVCVCICMYVNTAERLQLHKAVFYC